MINNNNKILRIAVIVHLTANISIICATNQFDGIDEEPREISIISVGGQEIGPQWVYLQNEENPHVLQGNVYNVMNNLELIPVDGAVEEEEESFTKSIFQKVTSWFERKQRPPQPEELRVKHASEALARAADYYYGAEPNFRLSLRNLKASAKLGNTEASYFYGSLLVELPDEFMDKLSDYVTPDWDAGLKLLTYAASKDCKKAKDLLEFA